MATKGTSASRRRPARKTARAAAPASAPPREAPRVPKMLTPEQAIEMYKATARLALDVINAAIEGTERLRRKQFEGEESPRAFQKKHVRTTGPATDAHALMALGQGAAQEALAKSMHCGGEMFELNLEIQKRLFTLLEVQTKDVPGVK